MATILISFIGRPKPGVVPASYTGYERTRYRFPAEGACLEQEFDTSLFGSGLLQRLKTIRQPVARWLVMGTAQSIWANLIEATSDEKWEALIVASDVVQQHVVTGTVTQALLDTWQSELTAAFDDTVCSCRLVGAADTEASQMQIWQALAEAVRPGDSIVLDITHGFRHQPVLASFMVMMLRWLREVKQVVLYYGGLELKGNSPASPVLRLDICNQLIQATEAVATYRHTGNYQLLAKQLNLPTGLQQKVGVVALADETNRQEPAAAQAILKELKTIKFDPIKATLMPLLREPLEWAAKKTLAERMGSKARFANAHGQYFRSIALLWEAIRVCAAQHYGLNGLIWQDRDEAEQRLYQDPILTSAENKTLHQVEWLRNTVLHGTNNDWHRDSVPGALKSLKAFQQVFNEGDRLLLRLLGEFFPAKV